MNPDATQLPPAAGADAAAGALLRLAGGRIGLRRRPRERATFRAMTDHAMDLLAVVDAGGRYTYVSGAYERVLGVPPERLVGTSCFDHLRPDDQSRARAALGGRWRGPRART